LQLREKTKRDFPILRLDILGPPHTNPDGDFPFAGQQIDCPHIHIAHEVFGDTIAYPLNTKYANIYLTNEEILDMVLVLNRFLKKCNVGNAAEYQFNLQGQLF